MRMLTHGRVYRAVMSWDKADKPTKFGKSERSFCGECSAMLWNHEEEWAHVRLQILLSIQPAGVDPPHSGSTPLHRQSTRPIPFRPFPKEPT